MSLILDQQYQQPKKQSLPYYRMNLKSDRFIPDTPQVHRDPLDVQVLREIDQNDSKINKLIRSVVLNQGVKKVFKRNENKIQNKSLKCIDFNYQQTKDQGNGRSYQYLNLLGLQKVSKVDLGAAVLSKPQKALFAENLKDDFYLNLLDCSPNSILAVGLQTGIYLWRKSKSIFKFKQLQGTTCLKWSHITPQLLAIGTLQGRMQILDAQKKSSIGVFKDHRSRVGTIAWLNNKNTLLTGSRDNNIFCYDLRSKKNTGSYNFHEEEICPLKVCYNGSIYNQVFASGGNDQQLMIWNTRMKIPELIYKHDGVVKGVAWHPHRQGILTSGGGSNDKKIRVWDCKQNKLLNCIKTGSQICNLMFIKNGKFLLSSHGYNKFQTNIWEYQSNESIIKKQTLVGHKNRVLYLTAFPKGDTIVTGAGDQTIKFWKFKHKEQKVWKKEPLETFMAIR